MNLDQFKVKIGVKASCFKTFIFILTKT